MTHRVLILALQLQRHMDRYRERLARLGVEVEVPTVVQRMREHELLDIIGRFDGVIAGDDEFTAGVLKAGTRLKVVAKWGVGVDGIDREAAAALGIQVSATPGVFSDAVADVVTGYIILLARRLHELDRGVRAGGWPKVQGQSLVDKRLGVIGVGSIGRGVIRRARALGMTVCGYDVAGVPEAYCRETDLEPLDLNALLEKSDFVSLNCPLTPQTRHMLGEAEFARMKDGAFVINTGRGPLIDEAALVLGLRQGKIAGAALDVFEEEPLPADSPLREFDNCIFGTHNASNTLEAVLHVNTLAIDNLLRGLGLAE